MQELGGQRGEGANFRDKLLHEGRLLDGGSMLQCFVRNISVAVWVQQNGIETNCNALADFSHINVNTDAIS